MQFDPETVFKPTQNVAWRDVNDEVVILDLKSGEYYTLNSVGQFIWKSAMQDMPLTDIQQAIVDEFDVAPERAEKDLHEFVAAMIQEGMLHEEPRQ